MPAQEIEQTLTYKINDMKKGVDFIGVTCAFYCHDGKGNILLQKRSQACRDEQGRWDSGAGSMEFGEENFESVVRREINEELCVDPISVTHVATTNIIREYDGKTTHWIGLVHVALLPEGSGDVGEPHKIDEIAWFAHNELPDNLHSVFDRHFALVRDHIIHQQD